MKETNLQKPIINEDTPVSFFHCPEEEKVTFTNVKIIV